MRNIYPSRPFHRIRNRPLGSLLLNTQRFGHFHQFAGDPVVVVVGETQSAQRIQVVGIEAGRDQQQFRPEAPQRRQDNVIEGGAEFCEVFYDNVRIPLTNVVGEIDKGFLVLLGVATGDDDEAGTWMARKIAGLRVFPDEAGRMNLDLAAAAGEVLLVSQFTLQADCRRGNRPSFIAAAAPEPSIWVEAAAADIPCMDIMESAPESPPTTRTSSNVST